jgi:glycosyltransferase involved in cell wall biosynthesis
MRDKYKIRVLVNSVPKSGTNLVQKCLELAEVPYSRKSIAASSMFGRYAQAKLMLRYMRTREVPVVIGLEIPIGVSPSWLAEYLRSARGYVSGHGAYSSHYHSILRSEGYKIIQVVRHPCAVLVSWGNYIIEPGYYWETARAIFSRMSTSERQRFLLFGGQLFDGNLNCYYRGLREIFGLLEGWVVSNDVLTVKYEDLVGSKGGGDDNIQRATISNIMQHIGIGLSDREINRIANNLYGGTHTFRNGATANWEGSLDEKLQELAYKELQDHSVFRGLNYFGTTSCIADEYANTKARYEQKTVVQLDEEKPLSVTSIASSSRIDLNVSLDIKLNILHITEGYGASLFGVGKVVEDLQVRLVSRGLQVKVATLVVKAEDIPRNNTLVSKLSFWKWTGLFRYHYKQRREIIALLNNFRPDVIHVHGVFAPLQRTAVLIALKSEIPVVLSLHGMLQPWAWRQRGVFHFALKRLYWRVLLRPVLKRVQCVHVITRQEAEVCATEFPLLPQVLIPNAIDLTGHNPQQSAPARERYILFLGRLHPVKGIDLLIAAFAAMEHSGYKLVIAGPEHSASYTDQLRQMVVREKLMDDVSFVSGVFGAEKFDLLAKAWVVVVPSHSEVIALVNLEAAICYTPTITTNATGLSDWDKSGGVLIDPDVVQLTNALTQATSWGMEERLKRGRQARLFVEESYNWDRVVGVWLAAYQHAVLGKST